MRRYPWTGTHRTTPASGSPAIQTHVSQVCIGFRNNSHFCLYLDGSFLFGFTFIEKHLTPLSSATRWVTTCILRLSFIIFVGTVPLKEPQGLILITQHFQFQAKLSVTLIRWITVSHWVNNTLIPHMRKTIAPVTLCSLCVSVSAKKNKAKPELASSYKQRNQLLQLV